MSVNGVLNLVSARSLINSTGSVSVGNMSVISTVNVTKPGNLPALNNVMDIINYGADAAASVSKFNDAILAQTKTSDMPEFEAKVINILTLAKGVNLSDTTGDQSFFARIRGKAISSREHIVSKFTNLVPQIDNVLNEVSTLSYKLADRNNMLEELYTHNREEYENLEVAISYAIQVLAEKQADADSIQANIVSTDITAVQDLNDKNSFITRLEKRIDTLKRVKLTAIQTAPFIRLSQDNNLLLIEKFGDLTTLTIPAWKKQIALYLSLGDQKKGVQVSNAIDDATNAFMKSNSDALNQNTVDVYTASQRSVVDIETLQYVQNNLINTLTSISDITKAGQLKRKADQLELEKMQATYLDLAVNGHS